MSESGDLGAELYSHQCVRRVPMEFELLVPVSLNLLGEHPSKITWALEHRFRHAEWAPTLDDTLHLETAYIVPCAVDFIIAIFIAEGEHTVFGCQVSPCLYP